MLLAVKPLKCLHREEDELQNNMKDASFSETFCILHCKAVLDLRLARRNDIGTGIFTFRREAKGKLRHLLIEEDERHQVASDNPETKTQESVIIPAGQADKRFTKRSTSEGFGRAHTHLLKIGSCAERVGMMVSFAMHRIFLFSTNYYRWYGTDNIAAKIRYVHDKYNMKFIHRHSYQHQS